jgi:hypothetical protein
MRRNRDAFITSLNSQKVLPARSWPATVSDTAPQSREKKCQTLTDQERLAPGQAKLLPFEPQAVDHCWMQGAKSGGQKKIPAQNIRNVIGDKQPSSPGAFLSTFSPFPFFIPLYSSNFIEFSLHFLFEGSLF